MPKNPGFPVRLGTRSLSEVRRTLEQKDLIPPIQIEDEDVHVSSNLHGFDLRLGRDAHLKFGQFNGVSEAVPVTGEVQWMLHQAIPVLKGARPLDGNERVVVVHDGSLQVGLADRLAVDTGLPCPGVLLPLKAGAGVSARECWVVVLIVRRNNTAHLGVVWYEFSVKTVIETLPLRHGQLLKAISWITWRVVTNGFVVAFG